MIAKFEDLYCGDGWWDASPYWDKLKFIAQQRDLQKSSYKSTKNWSKESTHFLGLVGEFAFACETGIMFDTKTSKTGDNGYDFIYRKIKFDVKSTKYFHAPHLKNYPNPKTWVDYYLLAGVDLENQRSKIFGYANKEEMQNAKLHDYGYGLQRTIELQDLHFGLPTMLPSKRKILGLDVEVLH